MIFCQNAPTPTTSVTVLFGKKGFVPPKLDANFPNWDHCTALHHCTHCTSLQRIESNDKVRPLDKTPFLVRGIRRTNPKRPKRGSEDANSQRFIFARQVLQVLHDCHDTHTIARETDKKYSPDANSAVPVQARCRCRAQTGLTD